MFVLQTLEHFGRIDTLIANAGYDQYRLTHEMSGDDVRKMFATNVFGTTDTDSRGRAAHAPPGLQRGVAGK